MRRTLVIAIFAFACPGAASASTVTIGPPLPLNAQSINGAPCPSLGPDCWYTNVALPPGGVVEAPQSGTIVSWQAEGLAGSAQPVILAHDPSPDTFSIVSEGPQVSEPCGGAPSLCEGDTAVHSFSVSMPIAKGQFFGIRLLSAPNCTSGGAGAGCTTIGGATDEGVNGGSGGNTQPVGKPTLANNDPDSTIAVNATEQLDGGPEPMGFGGIDIEGSATQQVISTQNGEDTQLRISCEAGLEASACSGIASFAYCPKNRQKTANKAANCLVPSQDRSQDLTTDRKAARIAILAGKTGFTLAPGARKTIKIKLDAAARRLLAKLHELNGFVIVTERSGHATKVTIRKIKLHLKR